MNRVRTWVFALASVVSVGGLYYALTMFQAPKCEQVRAGLDVGSGSTKLMVANVDVCRKKVLKVLIDKSEKVDFQEDLNRSEDNNFSTEVIGEGARVLTALVAEAHAAGAPDAKGFATAAFRKAANGSEVIDKLSTASGARIQIISQEEEGSLGLEGVLTMVEASPDNLVVWDIGGGSQEITAQNQGRRLVHKGIIASVGFKDLVIQQIQKKNVETSKSPNPLSTEQAQSAIKASKAIAALIPADVKAVVGNPAVEVVGIGGVHWHSVRGQTGEPEIYTQADVAKALMNQTGKTDEQINSKFASTEVTNLALVLGHMQELNIQKVRPMKVNMAVPAMFR